MASLGLIDPTKTGNYPIILGDALLGKAQNEIFTGIRCTTSSPSCSASLKVLTLADNHKPALSSSSAPSSARLKPSVPGKTASYDLAYTDNDDKYAFTGTRSTDDNQHVLYFDPKRKAFILDKVDSTFNMNVTRLPDNTDQDSLRRQYPQIDSKTQYSQQTTTEKPAKAVEKPAAKPRAKPATQKKEVKRKPEKKQPPKNIELSLPVPMTAQPEKPAAPKSRPPPVNRNEDEEEGEEEEDDDDGGLLVEYPGANPSTSRRNDFSPAFPSVRRFDEFMDRRESEGDDADGESDDDPELDFKLPSPVNQPQHEPEPMQIDDEGAGFEDDLEKELENAFELELGNSAKNSGDESEISEED